MVMAQPPPLSSLVLVSRPCHSSSLVFQLFRFCGSPVRTSSPTLLHQSLLLHDDPHGRRRLRLRNLRHRILRPLRKCHFQAVAATPEGAVHACMRQVGLVITLVVFSQTDQVHGGQHDQAGGDWRPDRGCRKLECGEQHRGGKTKLKAAQRWKDSPIESKTFHC